MNLLNAAKTGFQQRGPKMDSVSRGMGGTMGGGFGYGFPRGGRNWNVEAGLRYDKSVVFAVITFACRVMGEVDIYVRRKNSQNEWAEVPNHPITELLKKPNPWYSLTTLMSGWILSEITSQFGCSFTYKHRSQAGRLAGLEYVPHFAIKPYVNPGTDNFIDAYYLSIRGGFKPIDPANILQQRFGPIDPLNPQVCYGPLNACLLEVCTDKEALNYTAALLYNMGVSPHLISPPPGKGSDDTQVVYDDTDGELIKQAFRGITGGRRGEPLVLPLPVHVDNLSMAPDDMNLDGIHSLSEERVCAAVGIPPLALNFGTGLQSSNNRAGAEAAAKAAARGFTKPYMIAKGAELTRDLVPELGELGDEVCFRYTDIEALQEDKTETAKRDQIEVETYVTVNEKRKEKGKPPIEGGDICLWRNVKVQTAEELPNDDPDDDGPATAAPTKKPKKTK